MSRFNEWLVIKIINGVSTVWCAYFFAFLALLGFPYGSSSIPAYIAWTSQTFIQLTMLSIIMVGQKVMTEHHQTHHDMHSRLEKKLDSVLELNS